MAEGQAVISGYDKAPEPVKAREIQGRIASGTSLTRWFFAGGSLLFLVLLWRAGPGAIGQLLLKAGWGLPLVFIPYAVMIACEVMGWWFAFPSSQPVRFPLLARLTVAAKALQLVTPSIAQAGEVLKIHLLRAAGFRLDISAASVVIAKTTMMIAELLFIALGLTVVLRFTAVEPVIAMSAALGVLVMGAAVGGVVFWQRNGLFRPLLWLSRRAGVLTAFVDRHAEWLSSTDTIVRDHLHEKRRFAWSCAWFFLAWTAGIVEVYAFMALLGLPLDLASVVVIQVWSVIVTRLTTFIPGNIGTQEAGTVMAFSFLGLSPESAMAFAVLRRLRQLGWIAAGLGCLGKMWRADERVWS